MFSEKDFFCFLFALDLGLIHLIPCVFWSEIFTRCSLLFVLGCGWVGPQFRPTRFVINFVFIIAKAERNVRFFVKLFHFFSNWILIRFSWNLSRLVPNSIGILTQNFNDKVFWEKNSEVCCAPRLYPLSRFVKFWPSFCNITLIISEKIYTSTFICYFLSSKEAHKTKSQNKI